MGGPAVWFLARVGDRIGRARSLAISILLFGLCTGLSGFSTGILDFCVYRFITGLESAASLDWLWALCADALPDRSRPPALGLLQALSRLAICSRAPRRWRWAIAS
jgi:MFS family permease